MPLDENRNSSVENFLTWLVETRTVSTSQYNRINDLMLATGESFDSVCTKTAAINDADLLEHLSVYTGISIADPNQLQATYDTRINNNYLETHRGIVIDQQDGNPALLALVDPFDKSFIDGIQFALGTRPNLTLVSNSQWEMLFYTQGPDQAGVEMGVSPDQTDIDRLSELASTEPVVRFANKIISDAASDGASDIHLEGGADEALVRFRKDGVLETRQTVSLSTCISAISRIKILAGLDIAERRRPQDGRFTFPVAGTAIDLRVSTIPTDHGESAVLRLLDKSAVALDYEALGFSSESIQVMKSILTKPHGIILLTGPTGSGKTTTLYTFLKNLATEDRKILTIEDPIEYRLPGISQSQVNPAIGVTFASALRSFLRHDPDIMMVGEIRDLETATIAIQAALTGHLVLSTLHTNDAASAITRLRDLGVEDYLIASTLNAVIAQRLVRKTCQACQGDANCDTCNGTGMKGRIAVAEILAINEELGELIRDGKSEREIKSASHSFTSLAQDAHRKVSKRLTSQAEIDRVLGAQHV